MPTGMVLPFFEINGVTLSTQPSQSTSFNKPGQYSEKVSQRQPSNPSLAFRPSNATVSHIDGVMLQTNATPLPVVVTPSDPMPNDDSALLIQRSYP